MAMRIVALVLAVLAGIVAVVSAANAGQIGSGAPLWRNVIVLLPSVLAIAGGISCLNYPKAATYLLGAAVLIFGLSENWIGLTLGVAAGAIEFHFGRSPKA
jgi:hypothetical protein